MPVGDIRRDRLSAGQMMEGNGTTRILPVPIGTDAAPAHVPPIVPAPAAPTASTQHFMRTLGIGYWAERRPSDPSQ